MDYEFQLFDRIIRGNLSPFSLQNNVEEYLKFLKEKNEESFNIITATFKKKRNNFILDNKEVINSLHPLALKESHAQIGFIPGDEH